MKIVSNVLITIILSTIGSIGAYRYAPMSWFETKQTPKFGTTITTINGSDTLSSSRTTINDNFSALNSGKIEVGSTTINALTSAPNLSTVGTITSGVWNGSVIDVARQGTGTTSPTLNQLMIGNGSSGFKVIGFGVSGQFLTSSGDGIAPSWTTAAIDQTLNYNFTGSAFRVKNLIASTTIGISNSGAGYNITLPSTQGAASTTLVNDGSGTLTWQGYTKKLYITPTTTCISPFSSATSTVYSIKIPGGTLGANNAVRVITEILADGSNNGTGIFWSLGYGNASTTVNTTIDTSYARTNGRIEAVLMGNGDTSSQFLKLHIDSLRYQSRTSTTTSQDSTADKYLTLRVNFTNNGGNDSFTCGVTIGEIIQ